MRPFLRRLCLATSPQVVASAMALAAVGRDHLNRAASFPREGSPPLSSAGTQVEKRCHRFAAQPAIEPLPQHDPTCPTALAAVVSFSTASLKRPSGVPRRLRPSGISRRAVLGDATADCITTYPAHNRVRIKRLLAQCERPDEGGAIGKRY